MDYEQMKENQDDPGEEFLGRHPVDGAYCRADAVSERERDSRKRYTVYVCYPFGSEQALVEEIDVDASNEDDARIIAEVALKCYYEPGGRITNIEERFGLYL